jgi:hypothetical protein
VNPVTYSTGVDVAVRFTKSKSDGPLLLAGAARSNSKPLPNLNATIDREAWVFRKISDLSILLATVNISRSEIWQKLPTLIRLLAPVGVVIYLS